MAENIAAVIAEWDGFQLKTVTVNGVVYTCDELAKIMGKIQKNTNWKACESALPHSRDAVIKELILAATNALEIAIAETIPAGKMGNMMAQIHNAIAMGKESLIEQINNVWLSMDSAPKDGTLFDLLVKSTYTDYQDKFFYHRVPDVCFDNGDLIKGERDEYNERALGKFSNGFEEAVGWMPTPVIPIPLTNKTGEQCH